MRTLRILPILVCLTTGMAAQAQAAPVALTSADVGSTFTVDYFFDTGMGELDATAHFTVNSFTDSQLGLTVAVTNNTDPALNEAVHALGWNMDPNATSLSLASGSVFSNADLNQTFPNFQTIDVCVWASGTCAGGAQPSGLQSGQTDTFSILLFGAYGDAPQVTLSTFAIKFQGDIGSFEFEGTPRNGDQPIPEPTTLTLFGVAGLLLGARFRRRA
jgi:hypothetical protein